MEPSGWWRRGGALLLDAIVLIVLSLAILLPAGFDAAHYLGSESSFLLAVAPEDLILLGVQAALALVYFPATMLAWEGRSLGKRVVGIRVVRRDGRRLGASTIVVREVLVKILILGILPLLALVDYPWALADRHNRALHDLLVGTQVVRDDSAEGRG